MIGPYPEKWEGEKIFVFGSNGAGRHGAGAALYALKNCGAVYGVGRGLVGNSYALPTRDNFIKPRHIDEVTKEIWQFLGFAYAMPHLDFYVTRVGCGLAGLNEKDVSRGFIYAPNNIILPVGWNRAPVTGIQRQWDDLALFRAKEKA